jgi:hypothetical protein
MFERILQAMTDETLVQSLHTVYLEMDAMKAFGTETASRYAAESFKQLIKDKNLDKS